MTSMVDLWALGICIDLYQPFFNVLLLVGYSGMTLYEAFTGASYLARHGNYISFY